MLFGEREASGVKEAQMFESESAFYRVETVLCLMKWFGHLKYQVLEFSQI